MSRSKSVESEDGFESSYTVPSYTVPSYILPSYTVPCYTGATPYENKALPTTSDVKPPLVAPPSLSIQLKKPSEEETSLYGSYVPSSGHFIPSLFPLYSPPSGVDGVFTTESLVTIYQKGQSTPTFVKKGTPGSFTPTIQSEVKAKLEVATDARRLMGDEFRKWPSIRKPDEHEKAVTEASEMRTSFRNLRAESMTLPNSADFESSSGKRQTKA